MFVIPLLPVKYIEIALNKQLPSATTTGTDESLKNSCKFDNTLGQ